MNNAARNNQRNEVIQIDLLALIKACWRQAWLIILVALICGSLAYVGTRYFITPTYRTYFSAYINNSVEMGSSTTITSSDLTASQSLAETAAGIIESATVLEQAAETAGLGEEDSAAVSTSVDSESGIITVYVVTTSPKISASYAAAIAEVAAEETARIVEGSSMQIIDQPKIPTTIYSPSYTKNTAMGLLAGVFWSAPLSFCRNCSMTVSRIRQSWRSATAFPFWARFPIGRAWARTRAIIIARRKRRSEENGDFRLKEKTDRARYLPPEQRFPLSDAGSV